MVAVMYYALNKFDERMKDNYSMMYILDTYMAFVEAIIPWTLKLAEENGEIQYYGAIDQLTYEYLILSLYDLGGFSLLKSTAEILDMASRELIFRGENKFSIDPASGLKFSVLAPIDRLSALYILKQQEISFYDNSMCTNKYVVDTLTRLTMMGYYSEWFGYGLTRLNEPSQRVMEFKPISWEQVEYPGPATLKF